MARKTKAQIRQEIEDALITSHHVQFQVPGSPWVWLTNQGTGTMSPDHALDFGTREAAERYIDRARDPRSSMKLKYAQWKDPSRLTGSPGKFDDQAVHAARSVTSFHDDDPNQGVSDAGTRALAPRERRKGRTFLRVAMSDLAV